MGRVMCPGYKISICMLWLLGWILSIMMYRKAKCIDVVNNNKIIIILGIFIYRIDRGTLKLGMLSIMGI